LFALDLRTGREVWRFKTEGEIISSPAIKGNKIYFGSWDCNFYCIDSATAKEIWRFHTSSSIKARTPPASEWFEFEVEISKEEVEEIKKEYGKGVNVSETEAIESDYAIKSEYQFKSEYHTKSEYR
jgi:hypothetical protein